MPKIPTEDLFLLIQSLSKAEKRYFKFYASIGSANPNNIYIQLFDAIEPMKKNNEQTLFKKIPQLNPRQLSNQKKYLRELIDRKSVV